MTIHVNIGDAKTRLSALIAAVERGEEVVVDRAGVPVVKIVAIAESAATDREEIARRRKSAFGMYRDAFKGFDTSIEALKAERGDPDEKWRRKLGSPD